MRIIAGSARGQPLRVPRGDTTRPTSDRVREAVFSSLGERVVDARVLDLFAGSGSLGLEAASRGARAVIFVERGRAAWSALEHNLASVRRHPGLATAMTIRRGDVFDQLPQLVARGDVFDLVLADPPYGETPQRLLAHPVLPTLLAPGGLLVLESARRDRIDPPPGWRVTRTAVYGDTAVRYCAFDASAG